MKRVSLSGSEKTVEGVWEWYKVLSTLSLEKKSQRLRELWHNQSVSDPRFFGMSVEEVDRFFDELNWLAMLDLLSAAEAAVRINYLNRVYRRWKDSVSRGFRGLYKTSGNSVRLVEILDIWKELVPAMKAAIGDFAGALNLRHWLAHGRYWTPKFGRDYSPGDVYDISFNLISAILS